MSELEINLVDILRTLLKEKKLIAIFILVPVLIGSLILFSMENEYQSFSRMIPESGSLTSSTSGGLKDLAGLAGINLKLNENSQELSPLLYPELARSSIFIDEVANTPIYFEADDTTISCYNYFMSYRSPPLSTYLLKYTVGLPGLIKELVVGTAVSISIDRTSLRYTKEEEYFYQDFRSRVVVNVDPETGIISVVSLLPDPVASAQITEVVVNKLIEDISNYKLTKANQKLNFIQQRVNETKSIYDKNLLILANFTDKNKNISSATFLVEKKRIENQVSLAFDVYSSLANQLEQAKIEVKEDTPIFTVLEKPRIPAEKEKPHRLMILIGLMILGFIASTFVIFMKPYFKKLIKQLKITLE